MIETAAVPILLKAVEWLFGEGSKILEERRERRTSQEEKSSSKSEEKHAKDPVQSPAVNTTSAETINSTEEAIKQPVSEVSWRDSEENIRHLLSLLEIYTKNYYLAKEQFAKWGSALVPAIIVNTLSEAENSIAETTKKLQIAVSKVYNKKVTSNEVELL